MVEVADRQIGAQLTQHLRHELELIVLHPHDRVLVGSVCRRLGEPAVDPHVRVPPHPAVAGLGDDVVVQRPDRVVREALVVELHVLRAESHRNEVRALEVEGLDIDVGLAGPADPRPVRLLHHGLERGDEAPG